MKKNSFRSYVATFALTLILTSASLAGEGHCPDAPPPPPSREGNGFVQVTVEESSVDQVLKSFWEFLMPDLF